MEHGRWQVTDAGWKVLKGEDRVELRKDLGAAAKASKARTRSAAATVGDADARLLAALKALRSELARAQNVPAYVVFSDRSLAEMATHRPTTLSALREIHGVGDTKLQRYGAAFLEVIAQTG